MDTVEQPEDEVLPEGTVYTRGRPGDEDKRGSSMVKKPAELKHYEE